MSLFARLRVGDPAPSLCLHSARDVLTFESLAGQPVVLALCEDGTRLAAHESVRAELRGLGAVLVVLSRDGLFMFRPDDEVELVASTDELNAAEVASMRSAYGLSPRARAGSGAGLFV